MPGNYQLSVDELVRECADVQSLGIGGVLLFGLPETKDEMASGAYADDGIVQRALRAIKSEVPRLLLITDVCNCEYTSHGHCGKIVGGDVDNDATLEWLAATAVSHARAGADVAFFVHDVLRGEVVPGYDVVMASLFLHHQESDEAGRFLLRRMGEMAGRLVLVNDQIDFEVTVVARGYKNLTLPVVLREKGGKKLDEKDVRIDDSGTDVKVRLRYRPKEPGEKTFEIETPAQDGEVEKDNNRVEHVVSVREVSTIKVLYVEGYRRYEYHFLKTLLERESNRVKGNKTVELKVLLLDADPGYAISDRSALTSEPTGCSPWASSSSILRRVGSPSASKIPAGSAWASLIMVTLVSATLGLGQLGFGPAPVWPAQPAGGGV